MDVLRAAGEWSADLEVGFDHPLAAATRDAVGAAGRMALGYFGQAHGRWEKGPGQIVTDADLAIDAFLKGRLGEIEPRAAWLSEETEDDRRRLACERVWVVDPIDGTRSFAEGRPEFTICVGLLEADRPILGLVLNPATGELFEAVRGHGARLNGQVIRTARADRVLGARIVVSKYENRKRQFARLLPGAEVGSIGSLALKLCLVASGRYDGYLTWRKTHDWDIAAAAIILEEAGAMMADPDGEPIRLNRPEPHHQGLVAANPALVQAVLAATREARQSARP